MTENPDYIDARVEAGGMIRRELQLFLDKGILTTRLLTEATISGARNTNGQSYEEYKLTDIPDDELVPVRQAFEMLTPLMRSFEDNVLLNGLYKATEESDSAGMSFYGEGWKILTYSAGSRLQITIEDLVTGESMTFSAEEAPEENSYPGPLNTKSMDCTAETGKWLLETVISQWPFMLQSDKHVTP